MIEEHEKIEALLDELEASPDASAFERLSVKLLRRMDRRCEDTQAALTAHIADEETLIQTWRDAKGAGRLVLWAVGALTSLAAAVMWIREHFTIGLR